MKVKEIIVVEGKADRNKVLQAVQADTIETEGSALSKDILKQIKHAQEKRGVIIFTDPDSQGERIRQRIDEAVSGCKHAFLTIEEAKPKRKGESIGIEHATTETIRKALKGVYELEERQKDSFTIRDLMHYGLLAGNNSKQRRHRLGEILRIGQPNGKQLLHRLTMFNISKKQFEQAIKIVLEEEKDGS